VTEALFVLSTGRCGTQWLAHVLDRVAGGRAEVRHEPLDDDYKPRRMLAAGDPSRLDPELAEPILDHVAQIEATLATRSYIECGHPSWSSLPYLLARFEGRVRVIHLVRHPVTTAWSWVTQQAYCPPMGPHVKEKILLSPFDAGVRFPAFRERWPALTPYEKALFYWAEVNALGLRLEATAGVPWLRLHFETLFRDDSVRRLLAFAGLAGEGSSADLKDEIVDEFHAYAGFWTDPRAVLRHPEVLQLAQALGYDPLAFDEAKLRRRYGGV
jgi:hypothetical protein